ncbi:MAG: hypothetical protein OXB99_11895 [Acidimicrobiaceae bacterium]|nr:hypothetical protein [Acidimicrobiaceae bacterium]
MFWFSVQTAKIAVTCRAAGYANGIRQVDLAAALPCAEPLSGLAAGTTATSGTIVADPACTSAERHRANPSRSLQKNYYARRHTFTLASPAWVTVSLVGANRFGTYLVLLEGHSPDGTVLAPDNNSGRRGDRLAGVFLESGRYTVEATTSRPRSFRDHRPIGDYGLAISVDLTPRVGQPSRLSVEKGGTISESWPYEPAAATVTLAASDSLKATVSRSTTTGSKGSATLRAAPTRIGKYTATVTYANSTGSLSEDTEIVVDGNCPPTGADRLRARRMHHHDDGHGHTGCNAHEPPICETSYWNSWTPDGRRGHLERNLEQCSSKYNIGIIDDSELELLPWTPYDVDRAGRPIICKKVSPVQFRLPSNQLSMCLKAHNLALVTWASGFAVDAAIAEYEQGKGRTVRADVRRDLQAIQRAIDKGEMVLVGTSALPPVTGITALDDAFQEILCKGVVGRTVGTVANKATKRVGAWAANQIPILQGLTKVNAVLSIISTVVGVAYSNFAKNALCE